VIQDQFFLGIIAVFVPASLSWAFYPCPPLNSILTLVTVWRITGKIIRTLPLLSHMRIWRVLFSRVVKRSSDLRTSNFKFEFVFQPFDIRIQASLIRRRRFCLESGLLLHQRCTVWRFLCSLPAVNSSDARCMFAYSSPPFPAYCITLRLALCPWRMLYTDASYHGDKSWWPRQRADINGWQ